jgi:hypothetical protein
MILDWRLVTPTVRGESFEKELPSTSSRGTSSEPLSLRVSVTVRGEECTHVSNHEHLRVTK